MRPASNYTSPENQNVLKKDNCREAASQRVHAGAAVDQQILAIDLAGLNAAQKRAGVAEFAWVTEPAGWVPPFFGPPWAGIDIMRHEFPNLNAVHFVLRGLLGTGGTSDLRVDQVGKAVGGYILSKVVEIPVELLDTNTRCFGRNILSTCPGSRRMMPGQA